MGGLGIALVSLLLLGAPSPSTRIINVPERPGTPSHAVRVRFWAADGAGPHPLVVYEPGWNGSADENMLLLASLARGGFDVAALDTAIPQPFGFAAEAARLTTAMDLSSYSALQRTVTEGDWRVSLLAGDVVSSLEQLPEASSAPAIGVLGYSFGGAVAAEACLEEPRFAACLNMDGWLFGRAADQPAPQPYMLLSGYPYPTKPQPATDPASTLDERDATRLRARMAEVGGAYGQIEGMRHADFTDRWGGNSAVRKLVQAFFETYLLGRVSPLLTVDHPLPGVTLTRRDGLKSSE